MSKAQQESQYAEVTPVGVMHGNGQITVTVRSTSVRADIHVGAGADTVETVLRILKLC